MLERKHDRFRARVKRERQRPKAAAENGDPYRQPEGGRILSERLRECSEKPGPQFETMGLVAYFMNFAVSARDQCFEIRSDFRLGGEGSDLSQVRGSALIEVMEMFGLREVQPQLGVVFKSSQQ